MNSEQKLHTIKYLSIFQGLIGEVQSKSNLLHNKLKSNPALLEEIEKDAGLLETSMDSVKLALEFIESFPVDEPSIDMDIAAHC